MPWGVVLYVKISGLNDYFVCKMYFFSVNYLKSNQTVAATMHLVSAVCRGRVCVESDVG